MEENRTLHYYNEKARAFAQDTAHANVSSILTEFTGLLPTGASVLDWGCGTGRDSRAMLDFGFSVVSTDVSPAMCEVAKNLFGIEAICESFEDLEAKNEFDGIWACASLLHVSKTDLPAAFQTARQALKPEGVLYVSFKYGSFEGVRGERWFTDLNEETLAKLVESDFYILKMWMTGDVRPGRAEEKWLNCLLRKRS